MTLLTSFSDLTVSDLLAHADLQTIHGDFFQASHAYQEVLKRSPTCASAYTGLAMIAKQQNKFATALSALDHSRQILENIPEEREQLAHVEAEIGFVLYRMANARNAIKHWQRSMTIVPSQQVQAWLTEAERIADVWLSVIIPSYNHALFIADTIESVFAQTYKNIELFVIDDHSTDDSAHIIKQMQEKYAFTFICRKKNMGPNYNFNECAALATGKYIAGLDSDDLWLPEKTALQIAALEAHPKAVVCYGLHQALFDGGHLTPPDKSHIISGRVFNQLLFGSWLLPVVTIIRKSAYDRTKGLDNTIFQGDWDVYLKLAKEGPFIALDQVVGHYRRHEANTWFSGNHELMYINRMTILEKWKSEPLYELAEEQKWLFHSQSITNLDCIERLLEKRPNDAQLYFLKSNQAKQQGFFEDARKSALCAVNLVDKNSPMAPFVYSNAISLHSADLDLVISLADQYQSAKSPKGPEPLYMAAETLSKNSNSIPENVIHDYLDCIKKLLEQCLVIGESRSKLWKIVGAGSFMPCEMLAELSHAFGQYDEASQWMRKAIEFGSPVALSNFDDILQ